MIEVIPFVPNKNIEGEKAFEDNINYDELMEYVRGLIINNGYKRWRFRFVSLDNEQNTGYWCRFYNPFLSVYIYFTGSDVWEDFVWWAVEKYTHKTLHATLLRENVFDCEFSIRFREI